ncbi:hypothetical protein Indivirus_3_73 [Indivirus ILV1]|uniref:Uncharacterized protein n=1 Tax=Indivirus ILV1 TaxID=1977633 RepID=A0A1V0SDW3_9VIRU|nr:hypothetical protein Indivirus_3_73 [Indivirus ILV1]
MNLKKIKNNLPKDNVWNIRAIQSTIKEIISKKLHESNKEINDTYHKFMDSVPLAVNYIICYPDYFTIYLTGGWTTGTSTMRTHVGAFISDNESSICFSDDQEKLWKKLNDLI